MKPTVWLLSAYRSDSHAAWCDWLQANITDCHWQVLELPGRHFAWRIRGNPLSWLDCLPAAPPKLLLATSMVDLATLKGLHPRLAHVPTLVYFHENQFAYPRSHHQVTSLEARMVQIYAALAADRILFNSRFNQDSFLTGVDQLMAVLPDHVPDRLGARLATRSAILPVPVKPIRPAHQREPGLIVWNHRWEYDKAPERFTDAMLALAEQGKDFRLALLGKRPQRTPEPLQRLRRELPDRIVADGRLPREQYCELLGRADIAISTAIHEFQGISMIEATSAGALPLVPDALCYREQYPQQYRYPPGNTNALVERLVQWLDGNRPAPVDISDWLESRLAPAWHSLFPDP
jgi:glycosyltransferase involved in cell wall biosynthesis